MQNAQKTHGLIFMNGDRIEVYSTRPTGVGPVQYFWQLFGKPDSKLHGPFNTEIDAHMHVRGFYAAKAANPTITSIDRLPNVIQLRSNVIHVDFKNKKRA